MLLAVAPSNRRAVPTRLQPTDGWQEKSAAFGGAQMVGWIEQFCRSVALPAGASDRHANQFNALTAVAIPTQAEHSFEHA
jgi:hypothetical protein